MNEMEQKDLELQAPEEAPEAQQVLQSEGYTERPRSHRVLAWVLAGLMILGVILYFGWIAGILH